MSGKAFTAGWSDYVTRPLKDGEYKPRILPCVGGWRVLLRLGTQYAHRYWGPVRATPRAAYDGYLESLHER